MIKSENAIFPEQKELLEFMREYDIKVKLVAELLGVSISFVHFYRRGCYANKSLKISKETLDTLKSKYKAYMLDKLALI